MKSKVLVIVGPTASGKSELAIRFAKKFKGEIISADSRQIYNGLNIGTAKIPGRWRNFPFKRRSPLKGKMAFFYKNVPHHCIDFVSPKKIFTAAEFKKCAEAAIKDITSRGKLAILAGGTAFWIDVVIYGLNLPSVPPNLVLRKKLEKKSAAKLLLMLRKLDSARAETIEQQNPRRLIRAVEIAKAIGKVPKLKKTLPYRVLWVGLNPAHQILEKKIKKRAKSMIAQGLVQETKELLFKRISKKRIREFGFEYTVALDYLQGKLTRRKLEERLISDTIRYAKKQLGWWKRNPKIKWCLNADQALRALRQNNL